MRQHLISFIALLAAATIVISALDFDHCNRTNHSYGTHVSYSELTTRNPEGGLPFGLQQEPAASPRSPHAEDTNAAGIPIWFSRSRSVSPEPPAMLPLAAMSELSPMQMPPLDVGMVNVTGGVDGNGQTAGYRVVPYSGEFSIAVPYDPSLLPQGFTEDDIQTYVFDRQYNRWVAIPRDSVNVEAQVICSRYRPWDKGLPRTQNNMLNPQDALSITQNMASVNAPGEGGGDSPLDFINAVLKTPEMPETSAYTPTSIKDLKAADPLEGLTMIQPPTANNSGTANLSYPIEIPAGRQGMQPNLALTYSSGGGNGWLGVGWDISIPSITVETRWGVPRYDNDLESEVYVLEGEQLVTYDSTVGDFRKMPHRTNQWTSRNALGNEEQFFPRKNEAFDSIVRHGANPSNYWWTVTHKNGVTDYYGKYANDVGVNNSCVLRTGDNNASGAIAHWALAESVDPNGNSVRYYYDIAYCRGVSNGIWGKQIYADSISYTCVTDTDLALEESGKYSLTFQRKGNNRMDIITSLNRGIKEVTADVLCHLDVKYNDTLFRQYVFVTQNDRSSNYKTILTDIVRIDSPRVDIDCFNVLDTNYEVWYNFQDNGKDISYASRYHLDYYEYPVADSLYSPAVEITDLPNDNILLKGVKNTFHSTALGATKTKSWSLGGTGAAGLGPDVCTTIATFGASSTYSNSQSEGLLTLVDVDGDGLADKLYKKDGHLFYRKHVRVNEQLFTYGPEHALGSEVGDFLKESGNSISLGLQASCGVNVSLGVPLGWSTTTNYLSDINGDGMIDVVTDRGAFFGRRNPDSTISFSPINSVQTTVPGTDHSSDSYISAVTLGTGNCGGIIFDGEVNPNIACIPSQYEHILPISDTIPSWFFRDSNCTAQIIGYKRWDISPEVSHIDDSISMFKSENSPIVEGPIATDSMIVRSFCGKIDCTQDALSPDYDAVRVWVAPYNDYFTIFSAIRLVPDDTVLLKQSRYANGVFYSIEHNSDCFATTDGTIHATNTDCSIFGTITKYDTLFHIDTATFYAHKDDIFLFRLQSNGDRSFDRVAWTVKVEAQDNFGTGLDIYGRDNGLFRSDSDFVLTGRNYFQAPKDGRVWISGRLSYQDLGQTARLVIRRNSVIEYQQTLNSIGSFDAMLPGFNFEVDSLDSIIVSIDRCSTMNPQWPNIHFVPLLKYYPSVTAEIKDTVYYYPQIRMDIDHGSENPLMSLYRKYFGELYRGWGQFAYSAGNGYNQNCIDMSSLSLPQWYTATSIDDVDTSAFSAIIDTNDLENSLSAAVEATGNNPLADNTRWVGMVAYNEQGRYRGFGLNTAVSSLHLDNTEPSLSIPTADSIPGMLSYETTDVELESIPLYDHPVPVSISGEPVQTIRKRSRNEGFETSMGVDALIASLGFSTSIGTSFVQSDYMDLNGDRYPDPISTNGVQYTMPWGGIGTLQSLMLPVCDHLSATGSISNGQTSGRCYPTSKKMTSNNPKTAKMSLSGSGTTSTSDVSSSDDTDYMLMDVNGDGLPDMVNTSDGEVRLNIGYGFLNPESWGICYIRRGASRNHYNSSGVSGGWALLETDAVSNNDYSVAQCSISGGTGAGESENETTRQMMDVNGDGLPDNVQIGSGHIKVWYNLGNGQWSGQEDIQGLCINKSHSVNEDVNLGVTAGFTAFAILKINIGIQTSPYNRSLSTDVAQLTDINGDGYPDYVTSTSESSMTVRYNKSGKTNLLRKVTNFTGNTIDLDYELSIPCYEKPQRSWNLARMETHNNVDTCPVGGNRTLTTFEYENPHHNRYERMDYGYGSVTTYQYDTEGGDTLYRYTVEEFNNRDFNKRGRKTRDCVYDANHHPYIEHLYDAIVFDHVGSEVTDGGCARSDVYVGVESDLTNYYEGLSTAQITSRVVRKYDRYRNVTEYIHFGDTTHRDEYFKAAISYVSGMPHNLVALPEQIELTDYAGNLLQKRTASYYATGKLQQLVRHNGSIHAQYDFSYDTYGNLSSALLPQNSNGQRLSFTYQYDNTVYTYPVRVENASLGYYSTANYEYRFGKPTRTTDINGNVMQYEYDALGRTTKIVAPYELGNANPYTIRMEYHPHNFADLDIFNNDNNPYSYAITEHYDRQHPSNPIRTTLISDGLGRLLQTKKDAEIGGQEVSLVTGKVEYDCFGRTLKQYHPFTEPLGTEDAYNNTVVAGTETTTAYDIMDRQIQVTTPDGSTTNLVYGFGTHAGNRYFSTTTTDALNNAVTVLKGALGEQVKIVAPMNAITVFSYSPIGQLLTSTDPDGLTTSYQYDQFGQMIHRRHPDAGDDSYAFDPAGNPT